MQTKIQKLNKLIKTNKNIGIEKIQQLKTHELKKKNKYMKIHVYKSTTNKNRQKYMNWKKQICTKIKQRHNKYMYTK